jgi:hypothetical protein
MGTAYSLLIYYMPHSIHRASLAHLLTLLLLCAFCYTVRAQQQDVIVRVASETALYGDRFTLGDIARVSSPDATEVERLRSIPLGYAPIIGAVRELTRERIVIALNAANFPSVQLDAPPVVRLTRASQIVDAQTLTQAIEDAVLPRFRAAEVSVRLVRLTLSS